MPRPYTGGCACGAVRFETRHQPIFQNHCQCRDCQKRSGTGHGSYLTFPRRADARLTGEVTTWQVAGDSGTIKTHAFCPTCGTQVHLTFDSMPDLIAVPASSLDDPGRFAPQAVTFATRGHEWDVLSPSLPTFARMPSE